MVKRKKTDIVQFKLRIRESLRKQLEDAARVKDVSLNSEMVSRLEESFTRASTQDDMRAIVRDELGQQIGLWRPAVREATPSLNEALTADNEELEAKLTASISDLEKLKAQLTAMLEARQSKGG